MNIRQKLLWLLTAGVSETIGETPVNRYHTKPRSESLPGVSSKSAPTSDTASDILSNRAQTLAAEAVDLNDLYARRATFDGCPLKKTAAHTVNGRGVLPPTVLCLTETPDTSDDKEGLLFSGETGRLLDKMLAAIGLSLSENTYVSALIPWRPPGNRKPTQTEAALCRPFWEKEIELIRPGLILLFGAGAASELLGIDSLSKARASWHEYKGIPVCTTIAPATLLKLPAQKKQAWEDLQKLKAKYNG